MTQISLQTVAHLATLSSIALDDDEAVRLQQDIENIMTHIDMLGQLDTEGVEPTYQVTDLENVMRDDVPNDGGIENHQLVTLATDSSGNQIKVPKVL